MIVVAIEVTAIGACGVEVPLVILGVNGSVGVSGLIKIFSRAISLRLLNPAKIFPKNLPIPEKIEAAASSSWLMMFCSAS